MVSAFGEAPMTLGLWRAKWSTQRSDAKRRGIPFLLTFEEWFGIWKESRKLAQRGHGAGRYVMARVGDRGPYAVGNVRIILFEENAREYRPTFDAKTRTGAAHRGKVVSAETRGRLAQRASGRKLSLETRLKMSVSRKRTMLLAARDESGRFA
jgi:hypothetical protein